MATTDVLWTLDEHTKGKHAVLKSYLDAWLPILSRHNGRILFIDGFAGPGRYKGGEDGSPLIVIRCVREHTASAQITEVSCVFIEDHEDRAEHLASELTALEKAGAIPKKCKLSIARGKFDESLTKVLDSIEEQKKALAPALVMIDPFGVSDTPMSLIGRLFKNDKVEVYISYMYESINRFKNSAEFEPHLDKLYGTTEWRLAASIVDAGERKEFFFNLYAKQLKLAGAKYVVRFELFLGNRLKYAIFFATKNSLGADRMKQAIWRIAPTGDYAFRGSRHQQLALGMEEVDFLPLQSDIENFLRGKPTDSWTTVGQVEEFVIAETDYHSSQYKTNALKPLENAGRIEVDAETRKRKGTYPAGTRMRWKR